MSKDALTDLGNYSAQSMPGMEGLSLRIRAEQMRKHPQQAQGLLPRKPAQVVTKQPVQLDPSSDPATQQRAQYDTEMRKMFLPVEQGGSLITTATPVNLVGGGLPEGHSAVNLPQSMQKKLQGMLPDGVKAIGFHPGRMSDMQFNVLTYFNQQRDAERQADADKAIAQAVNPLEP